MLNYWHIVEITWMYLIRLKIIRVARNFLTENVFFTAAKSEYGRISFQWIYSTVQSRYTDQFEWKPNWFVRMKTNCILECLRKRILVGKFLPEKKTETENGPRFDTTKIMLRNLFLSYFCRI